MLTTDEIVAEYKSLAGVTRRSAGGPGYMYPFGVDEMHVDREGNDWYIITAFVTSLDNWLQEQCDSNEEQCGHAAPHKKFWLYPRYNVHGSVMSFVAMRWL